MAKRKITVTRNFLDSVMRSLMEVGYSGLSDYEQEVCDAFDHDAINVIENGGRDA